MDIQNELALFDLYDALTSQQRWRSTDKRHVGEWLGELAAQTIGTSDKVIFSEGVKTYGPIVGYEEMATLLTSDLKGKILCWFRYNSDSKTWTVGPLIVTLPFRNAMDDMYPRHEARLIKLTADEIFSGLFYRTDAKPQTIAQWLMQSAGGQILTMLNMGDYSRENATVVLEPTLNLMGDGVRYKWSEIKRIIALSAGDGDDVIAFALDRQGTDIKITNITLPASMEEAIKTVKREIEEARKQRKRFTPEEIFKGLMLLKGCTAKLSYSSWLEAAVQMLLNVKCQGYSDYDHRHKDDPQISWREAMDEFISETEPDMRLKAVYSLTDENGEEGDNTITFHDLLWTPSWMNGN